MRASEELFLLALEPTELRTLLAIRHLADGNSEVIATMGEIALLTGYGRTSLSKAVAGLQTAGFIEVVRTKRNYGKLSTNLYKLLPCSPERTSTHDYVAIDSYVLSNKVYNLTTNDSNSHMTRTTKGYKEVIVAGKWKPRGEDTTGDDNIGGFGLLGDEKPAEVKHKLSVSKRDSNTRGRRPEAEWTALDVAAEFSFQLGRKFPYLPGLVNTTNLGRALASNRKKYGITASIEMEVLRMFFGDARNLKDAEERPDLIWKKFLNSFKTHTHKAMLNLGMSQVEDEDAEEYIIASDGKQFENSIVGRASMRRYEEKLKETP